MESIATMQSIQASLLEYMMQFQLAVESQSKMNEIAYTVAITVITTALTLGIGGALGIGGGSVLGLIKEPLEEVFVDPIVEAIATKIVKDLGGDEYAQMIASTLAESGREGLSLRGARQQAQFNRDVKTRMDAKTISKAEAQRQIKAEIEANQQDSSTASKVAKTALMTLSIFGMVMGMGGLLGATGGLGITALSIFLMSHGGGFIDFLERLRQQEQLGIDQDLLQGASQVAVSGLPQIPSYNIKLSYVSDYVKNMKGLYELSNTQKPIATIEDVQKIGALLQFFGINIYKTESGLMRADPHIWALTELGRLGYSMTDKPLVYGGGLGARHIDNNRESFLNAYNRFVDRLKTRLDTIYGVAFDDLTLATFFEIGERYFISARSNIKNDMNRPTKVALSFLFKILATARVKIRQLSTKIDKVLVSEVSDIADIFYDYMEDVEYFKEINNPYYYPLYELSRSLALVLYKAGVIPSKSVRILENQFHISISQTLLSLKSNVEVEMDIRPYENLFLEIKNKYKNRLDQAGVYQDFLLVFETFFSSVVDNILPAQAVNTRRGNLILSIIDILPANSIKSTVSLSQILFNSPYKLGKYFFANKRLNSYPSFRNLNEIEQNIRRLDASRFESITGFDIEENQLDKYKEKIIQELHKHFSKDAYESEPEMLARFYIEHIFGDEFKRDYPSWLTGVGGLLELDGYNARLKIAFEYNGPQHYSLEFWINVYKLSAEIAQRRFDRQVQNDQIKRDKCESKEVVLIVIPYTISYENFQEFIESEYERITGIPPPKQSRIDYRDALKNYLGNRP